MVYETIAKGMDYICKNPGRALATAGAITLATILGGCKAAGPQQDTPFIQKLGAREQLGLYRARAEFYNKDKVINQEEVPEILALRKSVRSFKEGLKGDDAVTAAMRGEADSIDGTLNGYLSGLLTDPRLKANIILMRQGKGPKDSLTISGANNGKEAHIVYGGSAVDHIRDLGVKAEDIYKNMQPDSNWGYPEGYISAVFTKAEEGDKKAKEKVQEIKHNFATKTIEVVLADYGANVPKFFPGYKEVEGKIVGGELRAKDGTTMTVKKFQQELTRGEIKHVKIVYELEYKEGEKSEEDKLLEKLEERMREKGELPPKPQPRPRPSREEKKGRGFDNFGVEDD